MTIEKMPCRDVSDLAMVSRHSRQMDFWAHDGQVDYWNAAPSELSHKRQLCGIIAQSHESAVPAPAVEPVQQAVRQCQMPSMRSRETGDSIEARR